MRLGSTRPRGQRLSSSSPCSSGSPVRTKVYPRQLSAQRLRRQLRATASLPRSLAESSESRRVWRDAAPRLLVSCTPKLGGTVLPRSFCEHYDNTKRRDDEVSRTD